jgi:chromosome segregation ATPase
MHLEDVNVEGFKSFSERTSMSFQPGIGVIIGNNGVGKSNILDAILWALGEGRLERLRCLDPEELFFAGTKHSPPAEKIRVDLTFTESGTQGAPALVLVREMARDGKTRYLYGGAECSGHEYRQRLEKTRLKDSLRTVIKQEQINDLLLADPWQRYAWVQSMLGKNGAGDMDVCLLETISPLFQEYYHYLMPLADAGARIIERDGRKGVDIEVTLPGDRQRRAHQLSGGEKSVASLALKLAVFEQLDSPFYLLDEVEPALDYTNHKSMQALLKVLAQKKQLIMITHLRSTIELANTLHGVRTRFDGSSFMKFYFVMDKRLLRLYKCC